MKLNPIFSKNKTLTACACSVILALSGCSKDSDKDSDKDGPTNTADEATFKESGAGFMDMLRHSKRASVGKASQKRSAGPSSGRMAFAAIANFAQESGDDGASSGQSDENPSKDSPKDGTSSIVSSACPEFVVGGMPDSNAGEPESDESPDSGFNITRGESCADALKEMNAKYSQVLNDLEGQINALVNLNPDQLRSQCGLNAQKANIDKSKAAIAWRLTPSQDLGNGNSAAIEIFGGANGAVVTLGSNFQGKMDLSAMGPSFPDDQSDTDPSTKAPDWPRDDSSGDTSGGQSTWPKGRDENPGSPSASLGMMEFNGSNTTSGDLVARTLAAKTRAGFTMKMGDGNGGQGSAMSTIFDSQTNVSGLADGQRLKIGESISFDINVEGGQANGQTGGQKQAQKQSMSGTFNLTVEEIKADELKVTGNYDAGSGQKGQFELTMAKDRYGVCQVTNVKL